MESVWDGSHVMICDPHGDALYDFAKGYKPLRVLKAPTDSHGITFGNGAAWVIKKEVRPGAKPVWALFSSTNFQSWIRYAGIQDKGARTLHCFPLEEGEFLLFSTPGNPYRLGKHASPIAIGSSNQSGEIQTKSFLDLGLGEEVLEARKIPDGESAAPFRVKSKFNSLLPLLFSEAPFVKLPTGFALVSDHPGLIFVFGPRGQFKRMIRLFPSLTDDRLRNLETLEHAILGFQPTDDGRILVASRSEEAVLNARIRFPRDNSLDAYKNPESAKENARQEKLSVEAYPALVWWSVDPSTGQVTSVEPPLKVSGHFNSPEQISAFRFSILPSGNLLFGDPGQAQSEPGVNSK
jgi:hypothetical protein